MLAADSNASQITLVAPEATSSLIFSKNSVLNTSLYLNGRAVYEIATVDSAAERTAIKDVATGEVVVVIQRRTVLSDIVVFSARDGRGEVTVKLKEWLKEKTLENG